METPKGINILITGTPGTGKTSMSAMLADELDGFEHVEVGKIVKENQFFTAYDEAMDTHIIEEDDEDHLLDFMEPRMVKGGNHIVDYHSSELFPERWFHLVVVLHASTESIFDRLTERGYSEQKRSENLEAEIQCICEEETREAYRDDVVVVRQNDTLEEMSETIEFIKNRVEEIKVAQGL